ncbi:MAG: hypothetical protein JW841_10825, partial [Deltaproteobacteria bacterium]|nr:hypothetical protein [Deltaproteobacteria bacterium]
MRYILAHGVKEGLVAKCKQWPGLSSLPELTDGIKRSFIWPKALSTTANSSIERHKESNNKKEQENSYALHITQLPCFKGYHKTQVKVMKQQVVEIEAEYLMQRRGKAILGREKILAQHPHDKTMNIKRSPRPLCHATAKDDIAKYKDEYKEFATKYAEASEQYRKAIQNQETEVVAKFPDYSFPPPIIGLMVLVKHAVMWRNTV